MKEAVRHDKYGQAREVSNAHQIIKPNDSSSLVVTILVSDNAHQVTIKGGHNAKSRNRPRPTARTRDAAVV